MAIGRTFQESLQKAFRGLETGSSGFEPKLDLQDEESVASLRRELATPGAERIWYVGDAFRAGMTVEQVYDTSKIDPWYLVQIEELIKLEQLLSSTQLADIDYALMWKLKRDRKSTRTDTRHGAI